MADRMTDASVQPDDAAVAEWLGSEFARWKQIVEFIDTEYPCVFAPEWLYGGKKHGWSLRYKKSKSFCTLIPERDRLVVLIVFGAEERAKAEGILGELESHARSDYEAATTYHDGKWLTLAIDGDDVMRDAERLLRVKRRPKQLTTKD